MSRGARALGSGRPAACSEPGRIRAGSGPARRKQARIAGPDRRHVAATSCTTRARVAPLHDNAAMRILHTMLRVGDLQRSIRFYTEVLGMTLLHTTERPEQKYDLAFLGYGRNPEHAEIELTYNYGVTSYELGGAFGHIAIGVPDVHASCAALRDKAAALGGAVTREPGPVQGGTTMIAFVTDPDGYKIELIERAD